MKHSLLALAAVLCSATSALAQQAPWAAPDVPISHADRVYAAEQFSNTVSVTDPADNRLLGVIRLGDPQPANFSPLYRGQVLVHGLGYSPDGSTLVPNAVRSGSGTQHLQPLALAGRARHLTLSPRGGLGTPTSVSLFDQGLVQIFQGAVTGLLPKQAYVLALAPTATGAGELEPIAKFMTNTAGSAIVNATGPIRQIVQAYETSGRRWLVIAETSEAGLAANRVVQVQTAN